MTISKNIAELSDGLDNVIIQCDQKDAIQVSTQSEQANSENSPLDLEHLSKQTFGDKDLEAEVLSLFLGHSAKSVEQMKAATNQKDWGEAMHSIKGSARTIGAWELGDLAEKYETSTLPDSEPEFESAKLAASNAIETLLNILNAYIKGRS